jgi:hypothetical protein
MDRTQRQLGQAAVEAALTLPLMVFMVLGTLQLFMMLQGRLMAEHAAFKATRVGSVNHGECRRMTHAAVAALLPSFTTYLGPATPGATAAERLAQAWRMRSFAQPFANRFAGTPDSGHNRAIVWILRQRPTVGEVTPQAEDQFDDPGPRQNGEIGYRLEVRLVYWYPLRIPFANWVMAQMFRAYFGIQDYTYVNPLMAPQTAAWSRQSSNNLPAAIATEFDARFQLGQYSFPITATYAMRMMTPPRPRFFTTQNCPPAP